MESLGEGFVRLETIGRGTFGTVYLVHSQASPLTRPSTSRHGVEALKSIDLAPLDEARRRRALNEARLLQRLRHPYIVRYRTAFLHHSHLRIVMEHCPEGDLAQAIAEQRNRGYLFRPEQVLDWLTQLLLALDYLHHECQILHRDLKSQNVFLSGRRHLKLGDFGVATCLNSPDAFATTLVGTPYYLSPEIAAGRPYNRKSDVWAAGCIFYELMTLRRAFAAHSVTELLLRVSAAKFAPPSFIYPLPMHHLLEGMLASEAAARIDTLEALTSDVLRGALRKYARAARPLLLERVGLAAPTRTPSSVTGNKDPRPGRADLRDRACHHLGFAPPPMQPTPLLEEGNVAPAAAHKPTVRRESPINATASPVQACSPIPQQLLQRSSSNNGWMIVSHPPLTEPSSPPSQTTTRGCSPVEQLTAQPSPGTAIESSRGSDAQSAVSQGSTSSAATQRQAPANVVIEFLLHQQRLNLSVAPEARAYERLEAVRALLEERVGASLAVTAHTMIEDMVYGAASNITLRQLRRVLGQQRACYLPLLVQLVYAETALRYRGPDSVTFVS
ncbi:uncharacterized protein MONBRDRAFT_8570 [Monosiga brevicollis MX1]|uniref:non-specific serine/threonine protein kinase n=1 Tax=Monosiga brevicollis TaxID=81824 RepID=A9V0F6_MONBE|nr:uncharacterized protein MONBRDRAFT_8570 [Monosiga brevicollis MX1]EDQ89002.1 predicted protein [Monosiga brevicollis MX1]|eukprot:XP_001746107.1 hypothetical protein [Monosiga brevicollis MX1]